MSKQTKILIPIILVFIGMFIFNFYIERNARIKDFIRYPNPTIWNSDRAPRFEDFKIEKMFNGNLTEVNINNNSSAREFRSALRYAAKSGPNFAGHYAVAEWGCGSSCQDGMIIDLISGEVYDPFTEATSRGVDYKINSYLFITDPKDDSENEQGFISQLPVKYYIWKNNQLIQIYQED